MASPPTLLATTRLVQRHEAAAQALAFGREPIEHRQIILVEARRKQRIRRQNDDRRARDHGADCLCRTSLATVQKEYPPEVPVVVSVTLATTYICLADISLVTLHLPGISQARPVLRPYNLQDMSLFYV